MEYIEGAYTYTAKPTETTRNAETKISASKTEISVNENTLALLQSTDMFGRVLQKAVTTGNAETAQENTAPFAAVISDFTYETAGTSAKSRVATLQNRVTYGTAMTAENAVANYGLAYEYDANGNITAEYAVHADNSHTLRYRYTYDEANQLTRVDDNVRGKTFVYQYDKGGNRVSEKIYNYTLSNSLGAVQQTIESKYTFLTWKDRLSSYNGKSITYDVAGNPKKYGDTTYVWEGKQLVEIQPGDGSKTQFDYDADGLRTQKRQYGTDGRLEYFVDYVWQNGKLTQQILTLMGYRSDGSAYTVGPINTKFVYDGNSDQPTACFVGEQQMLFVRNLQGDIIAVATSDGEVVAEFSYDAWGNVEYTIPDGVDETFATFIPLFCPLTYRGYNYDFTTGLYYLQSRYYNPEWGRFMNVDDTSILLATQGTSHGANLFAYCENNPVNQVDYTGKLSINLSLNEVAQWIAALGIGLKILEKSDKYEYLLNLEFAGFFYDIDQYGLVIFRYVFKNSDNDYQTIRFVGGDTYSWCDFIKTENAKHGQWVDFSKELIEISYDAVMDGFSDNQEDAVGAAVVLCAFFSADLAIYLTGTGIILLQNRKSNAAHDRVVNSEVGKLLVCFEKPKSFRLYSSALIEAQRSAKPTKYEHDKVY